MDDARPSLVSLGWQRLLDGDSPWGSVDIRPDRFGVTRYRLVVYPPGISEAERRWVRVARGWPLWGALVWIVSEIFVSQLAGPWMALTISTALFLGLGVAAASMAGEQRRQVRTFAVTMMVGYRDPASAAQRDQLLNMAETLLAADERLARGEIPATAHEMAWWRVYDQMAPGHFPAAAA